MDCLKGILYSVTDIKISELRTISPEDIVLSDTDMNMYNKAQKWCQENNIVSVLADDKDYHFKLSLVYSSPYVVYAQGDLSLLNNNIIAIVGPRKCTPYAVQVMEALFFQMLEYDVVTISGLADGVDKMCHELSIKNNIPTIAILGGGLKHYLESKDRELIQKIIVNGGLVLSEFKLNSKPERYTFPQRNRIVAGLSDMVFLPEASEKSGSLITVDFARQMHKDVYGTPNSIFSPTSQGLHQYMQQGLVTPVVNWEWMLTKYFGRKISNETSIISNLGENLFQGEISQTIIVLQKNPSGLKLEELVSQTGLGIEEVMSELTMAEVMGEIRNDAGIWKVV